MKVLVAALSLLLFQVMELYAAGLGAPILSDPMDTSIHAEPAAAGRFFETDRLLTNAGLSYSPTYQLTLAPEVGVGYRGTGQELHGGLEQSTHRLHAQAGWRLSLAETFYLSAAAKLSVVTVESRGIAGGAELGTRPEAGWRTGYDFLNPSHTPLRWTGEFGVHLTPRTDVMLYYDQDPVTGWSYTGQRQEERVGTRFIFRFK
ncbi:hypothetical protein [Geomonas subterranea]|uniref:Outer membrane protein beta-barrel domain-containing protein n=1 Tax=Geomonas subterranea TaxID=2847989 RepID=A0ABX8LAY2_9BACT|nr:MULTISPECIES: hypothetical protein [Geomonas]QXE89151.1 hypothetical protein KP001_11805 [Geomonas subterranea]QXM08732.1 hypothetical protein KP002_17470 [Geomonas subterranea]